MKPYQVDEKLLTWATPTQKKYLLAVKEHGSMRAAARAVGVNYSSICGAMSALQGRAALSGYAPAQDLTHEVPSPFVVKGTSTLYGEDGEKKLQWVKTKTDDSQIEAVIRDFVAHLVEEAKGLAKPVPVPKHVNADILAVYPMGDPHFGMYAWAAEAGDDFDLEIAERLTLGAVDRLMASAPAAEVAVILPLGDLFHADDQTNQTPGHKNQLDVDSRYPKVLMVGIKAIRRCIVRALEKHKKVVVRLEPGNHDPHAKWAIALTLAAYFENEPRVEVDLSPSKFWFYRFGKVLIGSTHGDTVKHEQLPGIMAADRSEEWGQTKYRYWYTGHVHTQAVREFPGVVCESFRTLAAKDAWTASRGYRSGRDMYCIVHHKEFGEIERHRCDVAMLEAA